MPYYTPCRYCNGRKRAVKRFVADVVGVVTSRPKASVYNDDKNPDDCESSSVYLYSVSARQYE